MFLKIAPSPNNDDSPMPHVAIQTPSNEVPLEQLIQMIIGGLIIQNYPPHKILSAFNPDFIKNIGMPVLPKEEL
tara:strand:- start:420 stop:641 length:222 start_codon:yes stop_codon:yes gene_type:complete